MTVARTPAGLGHAGKALWRRIASEVDGDDLELRSDELLILEQAARQADTLATLEAALEGAPLVVRGSMGQDVAHPLLAEVRLGRAQLAQLLGRLNLGKAEAAPQTPRTASARRAAQARWSGAGLRGIGSTGRPGA